MEENITRHSTNIINISIYSRTPISTTKISEKIGSDSCKVYIESFDFNTTTPDAIAAKKNALSIIVAENETETKNLIEKLESNNVSFIKIFTDNDSHTTIENAVKEVVEMLTVGFTVKDFCAAFKCGITAEQIKKQLNCFKNGIDKVSLKKPATIGDGIISMSESYIQELTAYFDTRKDSLKLMKFVPASGAASRMFKFLNNFIANFNPDDDTVNEYIERNNDKELRAFLNGLNKFPFYYDVAEVLKQHPDYSDWNESTCIYHYVKSMLQDKQFDFANKPKGNLPFHKYDNLVATPVWEHLKECVAYTGSNNTANIHFTISEEHEEDFKDLITASKQNIENECNIALHHDFSFQHKNTDTIAVSPDNKPFRDDDDNIVFRPGGHGALINNLNDLKADIVFIKNIDNVSYDNVSVAALYKKALAGKLIQLQEKIFSHLEEIDKGNLNHDDVWDIITFAKDELFQYIPPEVVNYNFENRVAFALELLNRPIRICGMVKNEGEPGGGPFWVEGKKGKLSLQIVETSQIDLNKKEQSDIVSKATHFNPVDLVCGLKNYKGEYFDLTEYIDVDTGFIVQKNRLGKEVKSYELPGLWNGAMAGWITLFAEVPLETFSPVKTVNDLLKPAHQPK